MIKRNLTTKNSAMNVELPTKELRPTGDRRSPEDLASRLADEMSAAWHAGQRRSTEEFLRQYPELLQEPEAAIRLIYEEYCLRAEVGEAASASEIVRRFPQWRTQLEVLLDCHRLLDVPLGPALPTLSDSVGEFVLLAELGRGVQGRVYLASQPSLGDRLVVLKMTPRAGYEHLSLARLQHTHIMPLYAVKDDAESNLRTLCMPYFGGAALNQVFEQLHETPVRERTGAHLVVALDRAAAKAARWPTTGPDSSSASEPARVHDPARQRLGTASYVEAICWIGACLAEALHYAHERGLIHLDVKPGNVLLAADGQPMLLDFHVAQKPIRPGNAIPEWVGGTPTYMSPEQHLAMTAMNQGQPISAAVDGRSDIYSLGLLLHEALSGQVPLERHAPLPSLDRCNSCVSVGLADIIAKCLAANPLDRYSTAGSLVEDLRRHLSDLPLRGVRNRSLGERWRKWRRRRPNALGFTIMATAVFAAALSLGWVVHDRVNEQRDGAALALEEGRQHFRTRSYAKAVDTLARGLSRAEHLPDGGGALAKDLAGQLYLARRALTADQLHTLVERLRYLAGASSIPRGEVTSLTNRWRTVWDKRGLLKDPHGTRLEPELEQQLNTDLLELGILWADLRVRLAEPDKMHEAHREALKILSDTEAIYGLSHILCRQRHLSALALGQVDLAEVAARQAAELPPQTAWEHYVLGRALLQSGNLDQAAAALDRAVEMQPQDFWPNFYQGVCAYRRNQFDEAVAAFRVCIALTPGSAECYHNRALAQAGLGRNDHALADYDRALQLDPNLTAVFLNRGLLHLSQKRHTEARADLQQALRGGSDPGVVYYNLALIDIEQHDRPAAIANVRQAIRANGDHKAARTLLARLQR